MSRFHPKTLSPGAASAGLFSQANQMLGDGQRIATAAGLPASVTDAARQGARSGSSSS
jgi:hypothetical protein